MDFIKQKYKDFVGDNKENENNELSYKFPEAKFDTDKWSTCILAPTDDDELAVNKKAFGAITKHFNNVVSLIGPPGVGKSTLASTIYNVMRNDKNEYFAASDCLEGFTKGIWTLKEDIKILKANCDVINVLDLEGLEDEDVIHYLVVVGMALSKAILLCARYDGTPRFKFDVFKTLRSGIRVYKQNGIRVPEPIIYVQVPFGMNQFKLRNGSVDKNGLIQYIKKKYKELASFDIRLFSLPSFKNTNRFDKAYINSVTALIDELKLINEGIKTPDRVRYAFGVTAALNNNSPSMIADMNLRFFKNEIAYHADQIKANSIVTFRNIAESKTLAKNISFEEFCKSVSDDGKYRYGATIKQQAISLSYYEKDNAQHDRLIDEFDDEKKYYIEAKDQCKDIYEKAIACLKNKLVTKGQQIMRINNDAFEAFINNEIANEKDKINYDEKWKTRMSHDLRSHVQEKQRQLKTETIEKTQNLVELPKDYLDICILDKIWETAMNTLKAQWMEQKKRALVLRQKVYTSGNHDCPSCGRSHSSGISHSQCSNSILYWVDGPTMTMVCDKCSETMVCGSVCCAGCSTTMLCTIMAMK